MLDCQSTFMIIYNSLSKLLDYYVSFYSKWRQEARTVKSGLNALIMRRAKGAAGISAPLDTSSCTTKEPSTTEFFIETFKKIKRFFTQKSTPIPEFT